MDPATCRVCLADLVTSATGGEASYALECAHLYHRECLAGCVRRRIRQCPLCRWPMSPAVVRDLRPPEDSESREEEEEEESFRGLRMRESQRRREKLTALLRDRQFMAEAREAEDRLRSSGDIDTFNAFLDRHLST